jgi:hypothetical protein
VPHRKWPVFPAIDGPDSKRGVSPSNDSSQIVIYEDLKAGAVTSGRCGCCLYQVYKVYSEKQTLDN